MDPAGRIAFAHALQGVAILAVLVSHYIVVFWSRPDVVSQLTTAPVPPAAAALVPPLVAAFLSVPVEWGAFGVALFFVISGFVIPFSVRHLSAPGFIVSRALRIVPTYVAGFVLSLAALLLATWYFGTPWPYSRREVLIHAIPGLRDLLWSRHIDAVVWTLEIEVKFYLLCAVLAPLLRRNSLKVFAAPALLFLLALLAQPQLDGWLQHRLAAYKAGMTFYGFALYGSFMFTGVVFHYLHAGVLRPWQSVAFLAALFALFLGLLLLGPYTTETGKAPSYGLALLAFAGAYAVRKRWRTTPTLDFVARISYPLYVVHNIVGLVVLRILQERGWNAAAAVGLAWMVHRGVELPTQRLGRRWGQRLRSERVTSLP